MTMTCGGSRASDDRRVVSAGGKSDLGVFRWDIPMTPRPLAKILSSDSPNWDRFASDLDAVEWTMPGGVSSGRTRDTVTVIASVCSDQHTTGFTMLAYYNGTMDSWLASHY